MSYLRYRDLGIFDTVFEVSSGHADEVGGCSCVCWDVDVAEGCV